MASNLCGTLPVFAAETTDASQAAAEEMSYTGWKEDAVSGRMFWYESGVKQGTVSDPKILYKDGTPRGREICDTTPVNQKNWGWYWLDTVQDGARATGKEVYMPYVHQDEGKWTDQQKADFANTCDEGMKHFVYQAMQEKTGKWVRYDNSGKMMTGWVHITGRLAELYPEQKDNWYYYETHTGLMAKGWITMNGMNFHFNETTGVLMNGS